MQFVKAISQVAQAGQDGGALPVSGSARVLSQGDIPPIVGAVFDRRPMAANQAQQGSIVILLSREAGGVVSDFPRGRFFGLMVILGIALHGDDLPATTQTDVFGADSNPGDTPVIKASVFLLPDALRGENPAEPAGVGPYRGSHFGYL